MRAKKNKVETGVCKLTLKKGRFVDSHILPKALTMLSTKGERAIQAKLHRPEVRRFQGWYDNMLVIEEGEAILSHIDNKAIKLLRKQYLVWSGWPTAANKIPCPASQLLVIDQEGQAGYRAIEGVDFEPLKVFFLSIVWRAAASSREDMIDISLPDELIEKLRLATLNQQKLPTSEFPVLLFQISNRGIPHNRTPFIEKHSFDLNPPWQSLEYTFCRVYLDGLVAYIALDADERFAESFGPMIVGAKDKLLITIHPFESSRALSNLRELYVSSKR